MTREVWQRVQELLDARAENKTRKVRHDFAFTGLVRCGHCGCMLVGEVKKGRYVYYHCTGNRGKCPEPYTRQEILTEAFASILQELVIPPPILEWLGDTVLESDRTEQAAREEAIKRLQTQHDRIEERIETMYMDKLEGRITQEFFDRNSLTALSAGAAFAADAKAGQAVYDKSCKSCHGTDGTPNAGVAKAMKVEMQDLKSPEVQSKSDADLKKVITDGQGKMKPVAAVTGAAADNVVAYIKSLKK